MNQTLRDLALDYSVTYIASEQWVFTDKELVALVEAIKEKIYNQVKGELIRDKDIESEDDPLKREYLKGCNAGTVDALYHIEQFAKDAE